MAISDTIQSMYTNVENAYTSLSNKGATIPANKNLANLADCIDSVPSGGSGGEEKTVIIRDPYGSLIAEYTTEEFAALESYPQAPTLDRLTFQEYNWTLSDAKTYVANYGALNLGAIYTPTSGLTEIDITINKVAGYSVSIAMNGTKNWGDGTSDTSNSHTYSAYGDYMITCDGDVIYTSNNSRFFGGYNTNIILRSMRMGPNARMLSNYALANISSEFSITLSNTLIYSYQNAFNACSIKCIIYPNSCTYLDVSAHQDDKILEYVSLPKNISTFGMSCFSGCSSLKNITLPLSITTVHNSTFAYCYSLTKVVVPGNVITVKSNSFYYCYLLDNILLSEGIQTIEEQAFYYCYKLKNIIIPSTVTSVGNRLFQQCSGLETVEFKSSTLTVGISLFNGCYNLKRVNFSSNMSVTLDSLVSMFNNCCNLESVIIPDNIIYVGDYAFYYCSKLEHITLPSTVTTISQFAFQYMRSLKTLDMSSFTAVPSLGNTAVFSNTNKALKIIVPDSLYETWITTTNWVSYADYIYKASEVTQ